MCNDVLVSLLSDRLLDNHSNGTRRLAQCSRVLMRGFGEHMREVTDSRTAFERALLTDALTWKTGELEQSDSVRMHEQYLATVDVVTISGYLKCASFRDSKSMHANRT